MLMGYHIHRLNLLFAMLDDLKLTVSVQILAEFRDSFVQSLHKMNFTLPAIMIFNSPFMPLLFTFTGTTCFIMKQSEYPLLPFLKISSS